MNNQQFFYSDLTHHLIGVPSFINTLPEESLLNLKFPSYDEISSEEDTVSTPTSNSLKKFWN